MGRREAGIRLFLRLSLVNCALLNTREWCSQHGLWKGTLVSAWCTTSMAIQGGSGYSLCCLLFCLLWLEGSLANFPLFSAFPPYLTPPGAFAMDLLAAVTLGWLWLCAWLPRLPWKLAFIHRVLAERLVGLFSFCYHSSCSFRMPSSSLAKTFCFKE